MLDSIQFLFELGFVPRIALSAYRTPVDRTAIAKAVRRQIDTRTSGVGGALLLGAWPKEVSAAAGGRERGDVGGAGQGTNGGTNEDKAGTMNSLGLRILSMSRCVGGGC